MAHPKYKKALLCVAALWLGMTGLHAQVLRDLFVQMPDSLMPLLTRNNRLDMLDFFDSNMAARVKNRMDGNTEMTSLSDRFLNMRATASSSEALLLLFRADSTALLLRVSTFKAPSEESELNFYTTSWQPLDAKTLISPPVLNDFWLNGDTCDTARLAQAKRLFTTPFIKAEVKAAQNEICFSVSLLGLSAEDRKLVAPYLRESLSYKWNGIAFEPIVSGAKL